ncbi:methylated-DNA--[protein]-cysteine S-methyltransferase [Arenibaculum pallidiluteum]|uniref:methylated-DNA--[protein]-cysteine S-methyltransferase n=1 Tax=Arenibaculum pallidiluteum TaxID=2812559 RepID=UPI001A976D51|nr:methylated-DNA--[protein]-cysteine S-methyltransferase [Arenibaculum pallidiluteum]
MARLPVPSPLGPLTLTASSGALTALDWGDLGAEGDDPVLMRAAAQLADYFAERRRAFDLPLRPAGTDFQRRVWDVLAGIPCGCVATYGEVARRVGSSARAVGGACGANPLPIVIPCHRVVGTGGAGGYSGQGGLSTKEWLMRFEAGVRTLL